MKPIRKIIEAETAKWEAEGLISPSVAASIRKRYERDSAAGESRNWAFIVSCSVGALLVGLGIIALLAANWEYLTREMRAAAAVAPVLACALAAYWAAVKKFRSRFFWEATGTLWMMATIAALCIVATTYQVSRDAPALVLAMCLLTLPIVFITRAALPTVGWLVLPIVWYCQKRSHSAVCINAEIIKTFLGFVALEALGAVAVLRTVLAGEYRPLAAFVQLGTSLAAPYAATISTITFCGLFCSLSCHGGSSNTAGVLAILALIFAAGGFYHLGVMVRWECMKAAAILMCAVAFVTIPITEVQYDLWRMFNGEWDSQNVFPMLVPVAVFAVPALLNAAMCGKGRSWMLIALPAIFLATGFALPPDAASIAAYAIALCWSAWLFLRGVRGDDLKMMNTGTIGALYLILVKFIASDASFTAKGIILIASGGALTAANIWLIRRRRAKGGAK